MTVTGSGQIIRNPGGGGVAATWKGILLIKDDFDSWQTLTAGQLKAVTYDRVAIDTDEFLAMSSNTFSGVTVPTGCAMVCPADLPGLYRVTSGTATALAPNASGYDFTATLAKNDQEDSYDFRIASTETTGWSSLAVVPPGLFVLEAGDVVWMLAQNLSSAASATVLSRSWLLVEYLMPWEIDDT